MVSLRHTDSRARAEAAQGRETHDTSTRARTGEPWGRWAGRAVAIGIRGGAGYRTMSLVGGEVSLATTRGCSELEAVDETAPPPVARRSDPTYSPSSVWGDSLCTWRRLEAF